MIADTLQMIFAYIGNLFTSLFQAITWTAQSVTASLGIVGFLPPVIGTCVVLVVAISVINLFIGRNVGG